MYSHGADGSGGRRSFTLRRSLAALVVPAISLLLSGCLTTDAYLTVDDDGSGELRLEVFPPPAVSGALDTSGVEALARDTIEGVDGASFESKERSGQTFYTVTIPFEDFRQLTTDVIAGATVGGQRLTPFSQFDLRELPDGGWSLNAVTNPLDRAATLTEGSSLAGLQGLAATDEAGVGLELSVTLPGRLTDSNADFQEDNTARWNLSDPAATYELRMRTEATPLLTPLQWVLIGLLGVFVLGGVLMFVGATGPVKRKTLRKPSRKEHEAFLHNPAGGELPQPKVPRRHARRRRRMFSEGRRSWDDPLAHTEVDPMPPAESDPGPHPHRPLPPIDSSAMVAAPDPFAGEDPSGPGHVFPDSSPLLPEAVNEAHDPAHMEQVGHGERLSPPDVLLPGPSNDPDYNPDI